jgi:hypothetical protein
MGIGSGALPSLKNLQSKTPQDLVRTLGRFNMAPDMTSMVDNANKALARTYKLLESGEEPDDSTYAAIESEVDRAIASTLRDQVRNAIRGYKLGLLKGMGQDQRLTWVTTGTGVCPSCVKRHGKTKTLKQWQAVGLPGSAVLYCQNHCKCSLVPEA